jgi:hypothetical protein
VIAGSLIRRALVIGALAVSAAGALYMLERRIEQRGYDRAAAEYTAAIERQHADAAAALAEQIITTRSAEQALAAAKNKQDLKDSIDAKKIAELSIRLHAAAGRDSVFGGLRDPHASHCGCSGDRPQGEPATAPVAGPADRAQTGGLLSAELADLLQRLARDADDINGAYASCRADAWTVRAAP